MRPEADVVAEQELLVRATAAANAMEKSSKSKEASARKSEPVAPEAEFHVPEDQLSFQFGSAFGADDAGDGAGGGGSESSQDVSFSFDQPAVAPATGPSALRSSHSFKLPDFGMTMDPSLNVSVDSPIASLELQPVVAPQPVKMPAAAPVAAAAGPAAGPVGRKIIKARRRRDAGAPGGADVPDVDDANAPPKPGANSSASASRRLEMGRDSE